MDRRRGLSWAESRKSSKELADSRPQNSVDEHLVAQRRPIAEMVVGDRNRLLMHEGKDLNASRAGHGAVPNRNVDRPLEGGAQSIAILCDETNPLIEAEAFTLEVRSERCGILD